MREKLEPVGERFAFFELIGERLAPDKLHCVIERPIRATTDFVNGDDARVLELTGDARFAEESSHRRAGTTHRAGRRFQRRGSPMRLPS